MNAACEDGRPEGPAPAHGATRAWLRRAAEKFPLALIGRYAVSGASTSLCYFVLHFGLSAGLGWSTGIASATALLLAVIFQYTAHALFTYRRRWRDAGQISRFLASVGIGLAVSVLVTEVLRPSFGWSELASVLIVIVTLPITNLLLFTIWVFRGSQRTDKFR